MAGADVAYTYLHVFSPEVDSAADMSELVYPRIPVPVTTTTTITTVTSTASQFAENSTVDVNFTTTPQPETNNLTSRGYVVLPEPATITSPTDAERPLTSPDVTDVTSSLEWTMTSSRDDDVVVVFIAVGVVGGCLVVFTVLGLLALVVRRHRHTGKYDPSRPHAAETPCWGYCLCLPSTPGGSNLGEPAELDASTATLRPLNASPGSTAYSSFVSVDRPPSTNGVTTRRTDPVLRTLIGPPPPLTNDHVQSL